MAERRYKAQHGEDGKKPGGAPRQARSEEAPRHSAAFAQAKQHKEGGQNKPVGYIPRATPQAGQQKTAAAGPGGSSHIFGLLLPIVVALGVCAFAWTQMRVVDVEVNGSRQQIPIGTTIDRIVQSRPMASL